MNASRSSQIVSGADARDVVRRALAISTRAIGATLGPDGLVTVSEEAGGVCVSREGVDVARRFADMQGPGSIATRIVEEGLSALTRDVGEGASRTACLTDALYMATARHIQAGIPGKALVEGLRAAGQQVCTALRAQAVSLESTRPIVESACHDVEITELLAGMDASLLRDGVVLASEGNRPGFEVACYDGYAIDITADVVGPDRSERSLRHELGVVHVLVANEVIDDFGDLVPVLEQFALKGKALLIVARGITGKAREAIVLNRRALSMHLVGVAPSAVGEHAIHALEDLCVATGATLVSEETGLSMRTVQPTMLGKAMRCVIENGKALLIDPAGAPASRERRRRALLGEAERVKYLSLDRERLERRAARLSGRWSEIRVGAFTTAQGARRLSAVNSALASVRAAAREGVVAGGGQAVERAMSEVAAMLRRQGSAGAGVAADADIDAVREACAHILSTAGRAIRTRLASNAGVAPDAFRVPAGVVDPVSATIRIVQTALSLALSLLTVEVMIC